MVVRYNNKRGVQFQSTFNDNMQQKIAIKPKTSNRLTPLNKQFLIQLGFKLKQQQ